MPNHAPLPVAEQVSPPGLSREQCAALKAKYGIETDHHDNNIGSKKKQKLKDGKMKFDAEKVRGRTTKDGTPIPESSFYQSHHIQQDFALEGLVSRGVAWAVMLYDNLGNSEHGRITGIQNRRAANKGQPAPLGPAQNYGQLRECARMDLEQGFKAELKRTGMSEQEAKDLAGCIEEEAHQQNNKAYGARNDRKELTNDTPVAGAGCFAGETLIWTASGPLPAEQIVRGAALLTPNSVSPVQRIERCVSDMVTLVFDGWSVTIAPVHQVRLASGALKRVSTLSPGEALATRDGSAVLCAVQRRSELVPLFAFGLATSAQAFAGAGGLVVELPWLGPPQLDELPLLPWLSRCA